MCLCAFRLTNQKRVCPRALATQPIKSYFANPISKKEIGGARTRPFCHSVTACLNPLNMSDASEFVAMWAGWRWGPPTFHMF